MTVADMVTHIRTVAARHGVKDEVPLSEVLMAINDAASRVAAAVPINIKSTTLSPTVAGGNEYDLPTDLIKIRRVKISDTGQYLKRLNKYAGTELSYTAIDELSETVWEPVGSKLYLWDFSLDSGYKQAADVDEIVLVYQALLSEVTEDSMSSSVSGNRIADSAIENLAISFIVSANGDPLAAANYETRARYLILDIPTDASI